MRSQRNHSQRGRQTDTFDGTIKVSMELIEACMRKISPQMIRDRGVLYINLDANKEVFVPLDRLFEIPNRQTPLDLDMLEEEIRSYDYKVEMPIVLVKGGKYNLFRYDLI